MINKPSLLDTPNLINWKEYTPSDIPGSSVDYCYGNDSSIRQNYDGTDTAEWNTGKQIQETLPAAEWDAFIHDLGAFGWQMTEITRSIWEELYSAIHGQQPDMEHELLDAIGDNVQTLTNKTISFDNNTLQNVASLNTAQTLTNKTISFDNNTLQNIASLNTEQTLINKTLDLSSDTNKLFVSTANRVLVSNANKKIIPAAETTDTEIGYVHGVTSNIQTQLDGKQPTITGGATTITDSDLPASKALISDANGKVAASSVTTTDLGKVPTLCNILTPKQFRYTMPESSEVYGTYNLTDPNGVYFNSAGQCLVAGLYYIHLYRYVYGSTTTGKVSLRLTYTISGTTYNDFYNDWTDGVGRAACCIATLLVWLNVNDTVSYYYTASGAIATRNGRVYVVKII